MRAASVQLQARLQAHATTLARLWRVERRDGTVLRFTDNVRDIEIQLDSDDDVETYRADISFTSSSIFTSRSMSNSQSVTVTFIMSDDGFNEAEIRRRLYDGAACEVHVVDYKFPEYGTVHMFSGKWGTTQLSNLPVGTVEVVPDGSTINGIGIGGEKYSQTCRASLGDARCKIDIEALKVSFIVDSATGGSIVASELNQANKHWALGFIRWLTGDNAGTTSKVQSSSGVSNSVFLLEPPFYAISVGDTGEILPGCDKLRKTCFEKFNNVLNGRFEPDVPDGAGTPGSTYSFTRGGLPIG